MEGWIKLHRAIQEHWIWQDDKYFKWWIIILLNVNHKPKYFPIGDEILTCNPGQSFRSIDKWTSLFSCSKPTTIKFFNMLKKDNMIDRKNVGNGNRRKHLLTVVNWSEYQQMETENFTETVPETLPEINPNKNDNNEENEENIISAPVPSAVQSENFLITKKKRKLSGKRLEAFSRFWDIFSYKKGKAEAADSWLDIPSMTNHLCEEINKAAEIEAKRRPLLEASGKTPKMAQGWLSGRRWEDEFYTNYSNDQSETNKTSNSDQDAGVKVLRFNK